MNKPVTIICGAMAGVGLLILGSYFYHALAYGHGDFEAGNFHRCRYWSEVNVETGQMVKRWDRNQELTESTEGWFVYDIELWFVSLVLLFLSAAIWVGEWSGRHKYPAY